MQQMKKCIFIAILAIAASVAAYEAMRSDSPYANDAIPSAPNISQSSSRAGRGEHATMTDDIDGPLTASELLPGSVLERGESATMKDDRDEQLARSSPSPESVVSGNEAALNDAPQNDSVRESMMTGTNGWRGRKVEERREVYQSLARPFGLDVIAPVQMAESDESGKAFAKEVLPDVLEYIESNVVYTASNELRSVEATLSNLTLVTTAPVRVYFVSEDGAYHNSIGLHIGESPDSEMEAKLIFPDAASPYSYWKNVQDKAAANDLPLMPGDFVDIGPAEAGSSLSLFILPDGARQAQQAYGVTKELNDDQLAHARIFGVVGDSMILIGFEDLPGGGDKDYNDVMVAVEVGKENVQAISARLGLESAQ